MFDHHKVFIKSNEDIQRIAYFNPRYEKVDKEVAVPAFGDTPKWDGSQTRDKAKSIKLKSFKE